MSVKDLLSSALSGDSDALRPLSRTPQDELLNASRGADLMVRRESVAVVLRSLSNHSIDGDLAQAWASFVRRGYFAGKHAHGRLMPLDINYEPAYEDAIAEIIARLDQIGDSVDGTVPDDAELELLLLSLGLS
jgi:hypothetical protein